MTMNPFNPVTRFTLTVDKMIGTAYPHVEHVSKNIEYIKHVSYYLDKIIIVSDNMEQVLEFMESLPELLIEFEIVKQIASDFGDLNSALIYINNKVDEATDIFNNIETLSQTTITNINQIAETVETYRDESLSARDYAHEWASAPEDIPVNDEVNPEGFSAYHWAKKTEEEINNLGNVLVSDPQTLDAVNTLQAQANIGPVKFVTVAGLLSDTILSNAPASGRVAVAAGKIVEAQGYQYGVAATGATDHHVETAGGVKLYVLPTGSTYFAEAFGLVSDLTGNDGRGSGVVTGADQSALLQHVLSSVPDSAEINFGSLRIRFASNVTGNKSVTFTGNGDALLYGDGAVMTVTGALSGIGHVNAATVKGGAAITLNSAAGLSNDDIIIIHDQRPFSFSPFRDYYQDGEFNQVYVISGTDVSVRRPLKSAYPSGSDTKIFRMDRIDFRSSGVGYEGSGVRVLHISHAKIDIDANVNGGASAAMYIDRCFGGKIRGGSYNNYVPAGGTQYGLIIGNSQDIVVEPGVTAIAARHPIAMGGAGGDGCVPCDGVYVYKAVGVNTDGTTHGLDIHGNARDCGYSECVSSGSIGIGGRNTFARNCKVTARGNRAALSFHEVAGGFIDFSGCNVDFADGYVGVYVFASNSIAATKPINKDYDLIANDLIVNVSPTIQFIAAHANSTIGTVKWSISVDRLTLTGDYSALQNIMFLTTQNPAPAHTPAPVVARYISQKGVKYSGVISESVFQPHLTGGNWSTCRQEVPGTGSGPNGSWQRFADGRQVCTNVASHAAAIETAWKGLYRSTGLTWVYEKPFSTGTDGQTIFVATPRNESCLSVVGTTIGATQASYILVGGISEASATRTISVRAEGRWWT